MPLGSVGLAALYVVVLAMQGVLQQVAYQFPDLTQPILTFRFVHLGLLFIILRRLSQPVLHWHLIAMVMTLEVVLGITGFFAGFREPLVMAVAALFEIFDTRRLQHWLTLAAFAVVMLVISVFWMGVRGEYRKSFDNETFAQSRSAQFDRITALSSAFLQSESGDMWRDADRLADRLWVIYYPALAVARVPAILPHTNGSIISAALTHILSPRVFFPSKAEVQNDSDMVRKYAGVFVAGVEQNTSIAFGYAIESYIDFGIPWMFAPVLLYGLLAGLAYQALSNRIHHGELRAGLLAVIFWLSMYLFERSWVKTLGLFGTLVIYLGAPSLVLDYYLSRSRRRRPEVRFAHEVEGRWV